MKFSDLPSTTWRKSRYSSFEGQCTEVAYLRAGVAVRDSKDPDGPAPLFSPTAWRSFTGSLRNGARFRVDHGVVVGESP